LQTEHNAYISGAVMELELGLVHAMEPMPLGIQATSVQCSEGQACKEQHLH